MKSEEGWCKSCDVSRECTDHVGSDGIAGCCGVEGWSECVGEAPKDSGLPVASSKIERLTAEVEKERRDGGEACR